MAIKVEHVATGADLAPLFDVRKQVFNNEDNIPESVDFDGKDQAAEQFAAYDGATVIGTARYRELEDGTAKVERVAVLSKYRGQQVGKEIMLLLEATARNKGITKLVMEAKLTAANFYKKLGYETVGEVFEEVGLPHIKMQKVIKD